MESSSLSITTIILAAALIACLLFAPWLQADAGAAIPDWLGTVLGWVTPAASDLGGIVSMIVGLLENTVSLEGIEELSAVVSQLQGAEKFTALDLLQLDFVVWSVKAMIVMGLVTAIMAILTSILAWMRQTEGTQIAALSTAFVGVLCIAFMIVGMPSLLQLGVPNSVAIGIASALFALRIDFGFWLVLLVILSLTILCIFLYLSPPAPKRTRSASYGYRR